MKRSSHRTDTLQRTPPAGRQTKETHAAPPPLVLAVLGAEPLPAAARRSRDLAERAAPDVHGRAERRARALPPRPPTPATTFTSSSAGAMRKEDLSFLRPGAGAHVFTAVIAAPRAAVRRARRPALLAELVPGVRAARYHGAPPYGVGTIREADVSGTRWVEEMIAWDVDRRWRTPCSRRRRRLRTRRSSPSRSRTRPAARASAGRWRSSRVCRSGSPHRSRRC